MEKYNLAYTGEHLESSAGVLLKLTDIYENLAKRHHGNNPLADSVIVQLKEVARLMLEYTGVFSREVELDGEMKKNLDKALEKRGVRMDSIRVIERGDGHWELHVVIRASRRKCPTTREVAEIISDITERGFESSDNNRIMLNGIFNEYTFVESGRFHVVHGVARCNKAGNTVSGDNYSVNEVSKGKILVSLADGMGSGLDANQESSLVLELVEEAVKAGFSETAAIEMINTALAANDGLGAPVTIDMCVIDTLVGIANFIKLGAVATFIKRDGWVEIIQSETLPIGVLNQVDFDCSIKKMYAGDYIIMITDGILEAIPSLEKEKDFLEMIAQIPAGNPQGMAEEILTEVMELMVGREVSCPKDDMTVIVLGMFQKI